MVDRPNWTVKDLIALARSGATSRAYAADWRDYAAWCSAQDVAPYEATMEQIAAYLADRANVLAPRTLARRLTAVADYFRRNGRVLDRQHPLLRGVLAGHRRAVGVRPEGKAALCREEVEAIAAVLPQDLVGLRDRAILLLGYHTACRRSELAGLQVEHLTFSGNGIGVLIARAKEDQEQEGYLKGVLRIGGPACPVAATKAWILAARIGDGALFRGIRNRRVLAAGLTGQGISLIIKRAARTYGESQGWGRSRIEAVVRSVGAHSLRTGYVTSAARAGASDQMIAEQTGHRRLASIRHYIRAGRLFPDADRSQDDQPGWR